MCLFLRLFWRCILFFSFIQRLSYRGQETVQLLIDSRVTGVEDLALIVPSCKNLNLESDDKLNQLYLKPWKHFQNQVTKQLKMELRSWQNQVFIFDSNENLIKKFKDFIKMCNKKTQNQRIMCTLRVCVCLVFLCRVFFYFY